MNLRVEANCKICGVPMVAEAELDAASPCPLDQLDVFLKWLTCDPCLMRLGRLPKEYWPEKPDPADEPQTGLPYNDD